MTPDDVTMAARGVVLSAIEEQALLLMHDQPDRLRDPADYAGRFVAALLDIRRALGREWGWPDPRLPQWFGAERRPLVRGPIPMCSTGPDGSREVVMVTDMRAWLDGQAAINLGRSERGEEHNTERGSE